MVSKKSKWAQPISTTPEYLKPVHDQYPVQKKEAKRPKDKIIKETKNSVQLAEFEEENRKWARLQEKKHQEMNSVLTGTFTLRAPVGTGKKLVTNTYTMGQEMKPSFSEVALVLRKIVECGYDNLGIVPNGIPSDKLLACTKEDQVWLAPLLVQAIERKILAGVIDPTAPNMRALIIITNVLAWFWYQNHGPRPATNGLIHLARPQIIQDAPLTCPLCGHQLFPPKHFVFQKPKMVWFVKVGLPNHLADYHLYPEFQKKPVSKNTKKEG